MTSADQKSCRGTSWALFGNAGVFFSSLTPPKKIITNRDTWRLVMAEYKQHSPEIQLLYSQTYHGPPQKCTGLDQLMLARTPWEEVPILIRGVSLTHLVYPPTEETFAMIGSSATDGDILAQVSGAKTVAIFYPEGTGFLFPGRPATDHIDVHAWCASGVRHEVWLTIYYHKALDNMPNPIPVPRPDNDKLPEIAKRNPVYQFVPPDPAPPPTISDRIRAAIKRLMRVRVLFC